jgi:hypothetical protein
MVPPPWALPPACRDRGVGSADPPGYEVGRKKSLPHAHLEQLAADFSGAAIDFLRFFRHELAAESEM